MNSKLALLSLNRKFQHDNKMSQKLTAKSQSKKENQTQAHKIHKKKSPYVLLSK